MIHSKDRIRGHKWLALRAAVLRDRPLCVACEEKGRVTLAVEVDHVDGNYRNNARDNLQGLCHHCHADKTAAQRGAARNTGADEHGFPISGSHHWHREGR